MTILIHGRFCSTQNHFSVVVTFSLVVVAKRVPPMSNRSALEAVSLVALILFIGALKGGKVTADTKNACVLLGCYWWDFGRAWYGRG